ncbi:MAG: TIGR02444 family protein, partial [Kiloniellaceae bacterium]
MSAAPGDKASLWDYSVALYGRAGVEAACLGLQERRGADVNLLLLCCWVGGAGRVLRGDEIDRLVATVAPWRVAVIEPLRAVRRRLKAPPGDAPADAVGALRARVGKDEIEAEAIEQAMLADALFHRPAPPAAA